MKRRDVLKGLATGGILAALGSQRSAAAAAPKYGLGMVTYSLRFRAKAMKEANAKADLFEPLAFLEYCHSLGSGGIQTSLGVHDEAYCRTLRDKAESYGMFIEGMVGVPQDDSAVEEFDAKIRTAVLCGARGLRCVISTGRRYESYPSLDAFRQYQVSSRKAVERAVPVLEKHRMRLAIENHKDDLIGERLKLLKAISSEYVGACIDVGNNFALLEDPIEVVEAFAPWAVCVHLKDQAVREYEDGFLFGDVPLGDGIIDLKKAVAILRRAKPDACFGLELITREPLKVPCLKESYWITMGDVPATQLARTMRTVRAKAAPRLAEVDSLSPEKQLELETGFIAKSLEYAKKELGL